MSQISGATHAWGPNASLLSDRGQGLASSTIFALANAGFNWLKATDGGRIYRVVCQAFITQSPSYRAARATLKARP